MPGDVPEDDDLSVFAHHARVMVETSDFFDQIDLVKADHRACIRFRTLRRLYVENAIGLIDLIEENGDKLREQLKALLRVS